MNPLRDMDTSAIAEILEQRIFALTAERETLTARIAVIDRDMERLQPALAAMRNGTTIALDEAPALDPLVEGVRLHADAIRTEQEEL